jgi:glycosyltransferase involved in cell wall biosynthesis
MKNVCFFNSLNFWGGGEKLHLENAIEFKKLNYNVFLFCKIDSPLWNKSKDKNLIRVPINVGNLSFLNPFKIIKLFFLYKKYKIDTVIFSSSQDLKLGSISAYFANVERIVYLRGLAVPIKNNLVNKFIFKDILTHIIPNSEETRRNMMVFLGKYIRPNKIRTIYHGIDRDIIPSLNFQINDKIKEFGHGIILGNAGRLTKQKGQDKLIEVAYKLRNEGIDFTLFIAGSGELKSELDSLIDKYQLQKNVVLLEFVEEMDVFMNSIDIFLLTSEWEGFGFVLVEAMVKSKPIVAFNITSNPEIVQHEKSGFLVDFPDIESFKERIVQLSNDESLRKSMGLNGFNAVLDKFILQDKVLEIELFLKSSTIN